MCLSIDLLALSLSLEHTSLNTVVLDIETDTFTRSVLRQNQKHEIASNKKAIADKKSRLIIFKEIVLPSA